jgi:3-oxoacyl-[acyl-carrier protein] reductase
MTTLTGRTALVTGGSRGIGKAIALALGTAGCDVAVNYVSRAIDAEATADDIRALGRRAVAVRADVSKSADVSTMLATVENGLSPINLTSVFLTTQAVLPGMRARQWGRIINLTSVAAQLGSTIGVHYAAAKAGVIALTKSYARLLAKEGITVNAIAPALVATEMVRANPNIKPDMIPVGLFGEVEECADVAVLLAGNGYITGQTIGVNGGLSM